MGHFGSYLADKKDRELVLSIVRAGVQAVKIPIFVKIRLQDTYDDTVEMVQQLYEAGASLIAVHGRYRATYDRKGPGARDGPAMLDQIQKLKQTFPNKILVTNGNTITHDDVVANLKFTGADGIMSAEGILDNPALYLGRWGSRPEDDNLCRTTSVSIKGGAAIAERAKQTKLLSKLHKIEAIENKLQQGAGEGITNTITLTPKEEKKLSKKSKVLAKLEKIDREVCAKVGAMASSTTTLEELYKASDDRPQLALEYLNLARQYPTAMRTAIFHTRRMLKAELTTYQLMHDCISCKSLSELETIARKVQEYQSNPASFSYDLEKAKREKEELERKKQEAGKRKAYEARMVRKAKREGRSDLEYYLRQGAEVPTAETVANLKTLSKPEQLKLWKDKEHSQHCLGFHLGQCQRGNSCAFLHVAPSSNTTFDEEHEVAG